MIYPERMTPYDAAVLIYSQCYHKGDTPLKKSCHITSYPHECSTIRDAICEAIDNEALEWKPPKNCNSGFYGHMKDGARRDCQQITISRTDLKAWLEEFHPEMKPAFLFGDVGEVERFEKVTDAPAPREVESKTPFTQAIERLYRDLYDQNKYDALKRNCVDDFIKVLDSVIKQDKHNGVEFDNGLVNYIAERVAKVKFSKNGTATITTTDMEIDGPNGSKINHKPKTCEKLLVTKKLCQLRKKYPITL
ncbi:MAG: hypothetical protein J0652_07085 [Desulfobulbaceae bacterium]|nr:hypothetical protein [Desulfobulbaceae bacterium]